MEKRYVNIEENILIKNEKGEKIGGYTLAEFYEGHQEHLDRETGEHDWIEEGEEPEVEVAYVAAIGIDEKYQGQGYGTKFLKSLAKKYGRIYLSPENARCRHLYERIGEEVPYDRIPYEIVWNADNACHENDNGEIDEGFSGMYVIRG